MSAEAYVAQFLHVITHNAEILQPLMISDEEGLQSMITHAIETPQPLITFATDIMRPLVTNETEILRHQHQIKREQNLYSMRSWRMRSGAAELLRHAIKGLAELLQHAIKGLSEFLQHEFKGSFRISAV